MNRDNLLFTLVGLLAGFISGYFVHEVMAARQAPRFVNAGQVPPGHPGVEAPAEAPAAGPPMAEIARLQSRIEQDPEDAEALLQLANLNYDIRNWVRAQELYERYLGMRPESPDVLTDLGVVLREQGRFGPALERFERAQALASDHWQSLFNTVVVFAFDLQDFDRAEQVLSRLEALQPDNQDVQQLAAEVRRRASAQT